MLLDKWKGFESEILANGDSLPWGELDGRVARIIHDALEQLKDKKSQQIVQMAADIGRLFKDAWPEVVKEMPGDSALVSHQSALIKCLDQLGELPEYLIDLFAVLSLMLVSESRSRKGKQRNIAILDAMEAITTATTFEDMIAFAPNLKEKLEKQMVTAISTKGTDARHAASRKTKEYALEQARLIWHDNPEMNPHSLADNLKTDVFKYGKEVGFKSNADCQSVPVIVMRDNIYRWIRAAVKDGNLTTPS